VLSTPPPLSPATANVPEGGRGWVGFGTLHSEENGPNVGTKTSVLFLLLVVSSDIAVAVEAGGARGPSTV
jgi:hypothetical protein